MNFVILLRHYVSTGDYIHKIDGAGRKRCENSIISLKRHKDATGFLDHTVMSPTFRDEHTSRI